MKRISIFIVATLLLFATTAYANPIEINLSSLPQHVVKNGSTYTLKEGEYKITEPIDILEENVNNFAINNALSTLTIESTDSVLLKVSNFEIGKSGGKLISIGGSTDDLLGSLYVENNFTQSGGSIEVEGGTGKSTAGISVNKDFTQDGGDIKATGGSEEFAYGIFAGNDFTQNGGSIEAKGGSGESADGIFVENNFTQSKGQIEADGGSVSDAVGMAVYNNFTQNGGSIEAKGGSGKFTYGIYIHNDFTQNGGRIEADGGSESEAAGIYAYNDFFQNTGDIKATGGSEEFAYGIFAGNDFTQDGGNIEAEGGSEEYAYGLYSFNDFTQNGGSIIARGGTGYGAVGIFAGNDFTQDGGNIEAIGGSGEYAEGLYIYNGAIISNVLTISREDEAASVYVESSYGGKLTLSETSTLIPVIDLSKDAALASGLIVSEKEIEIVAGATLKPLLVNTGRLNGDNPSMDVLFMQANVSGGSYKIDGEYSNTNVLKTITMKYELDLTDTEYSITVTREKTPAEALAESNNKNVSQSDIAFADAMYKFLIKEENFEHKLNPALDEIDNSFEIDEALGVIGKLNPLSKVDFFIWQDVAARNVSDSQIRLMSLMNSADKFVIFGSNTKIEFGTYKDSKISSAGMTFENIYKLNNFTLGLEFKGMPISIRSDYGRTEGLYLSSMIAGSYTLDFGFWKPQIIANFGHSYSNISMQREDYFEDTYNADTYQHIVSAGLTFGNKFTILDNLSITAYVGLDYSFLRFAGYEEDNLDAMRVSVDAYDAHSLKPYVRAVLDYEIGKFIITGDVNCRVETLNNGFAGTIYLYDGEDTVIYEGSDVDHNTSRFELGVGVKGTYKPSEAVKVSTGYTFYLHGGYLSHQIDLNLGLNF